MLPKYKWRCMRCRSFPEEETHLLLRDRYGALLHFCPACHQPLCLVRVKWIPRAHYKKKPL